MNFYSGCQISATLSYRCHFLRQVSTYERDERVGGYFFAALVAVLAILFSCYLRDQSRLQKYGKETHLSIEMLSTSTRSIGSDVAMACRCLIERLKSVVES